MPRLVILVACQRVSYDSQDQTVTLQNLLQGLTLTVSKEAPTGPVVGLQRIDEAGVAAGIPVTWTAFAMWKREEGDEGREFAQILELVKPSGALSMQHRMPFVMEKSLHRLTVNVQNFPVDEAGDYELRCSLESDGQRTVLAEYPIAVTHVEPPAERGET
jgi:hypothetical protein